jgi:hypothetical protein
MLLLMVLNDEIRDAMGDRFPKHNRSKTFNPVLCPVVPESGKIFSDRLVQLTSRNVQSSKIIHAALLPLMLQAVSADLVSPSA